MTRSILLGSTALLLLSGATLAADLPARKSAPVEYVRVCSIGEVTGFVIPGSDTCLKVGGRVRAEYYYAEPFSRDANTTTTLARGYVTLDSVTASDYGPVRATTRVFLTRESGRVTAGSGAPGGTKFPSGTDANVTLDWAYIQFANITAGRIATSFFEFAPFGGVSYAGGGALGRGSDYGSINALAYTATLGSLSVTVALEDGSERRGGLVAEAFTPTYGGHVLPDLVGRLDWTAGWGQAALTGAVHQSRTGKAGDNAFTAGAIGETAYGFAVQGGVKINLPSGPGDALFAQAAYASGANSYTGWGSAGAGTLSPSSYDVAYEADGKATASKSWSVTGGLLHYWTPTVRQGVFAAYGRLDQYGNLDNTAAVSLGSNLVWTPVKNLDIGAEVVYGKTTAVPRSLRPLSASDHRDGWSGRLRFERDF